LEEKKMIVKETVLLENEMRLKEILGLLPKRCGMCRTIIGELLPKEDDICMECQSVGENIEWSAIEELEGIIDEMPLGGNYDE
jgi:hypothetical protein